MGHVIFGCRVCLYTTSTLAITFELLRIEISISGMHTSLIEPFLYTVITTLPLYTNLSIIGGIVFSNTFSLFISSVLDLNLVSSLNS